MDRTRIKIKQAAAEQNLDPTTFLNKMKQWEIVAGDKTVGGIITMDEYEKFKARRAEDEAPPKVVIRRGRRSAERASAAAGDAEKKNEGAQEAIPVSDVKDSEKENAAAKAGEPEKLPETAEDKAPETGSEKDKGGEKKASRQKQEGGSKSKKSPPRKQPEVVRARIIQPVAQPKAEETSRDLPKEAPKEEAAPALTQPKPEEALVAEASKPAAAQAKAEENVSDRHADAVESIPEAKAEASAQPLREAASDASARKEGESGSGATPEANAGEKPEPKQEKQKRVPAMSADPDGTARPGKLPAQAERKRTGQGEKRGEDPRKRQQGSSSDTPRVRVISRPENVAPQARPAQGSDGESRFHRDGQRRDGARSGRTDARDGRFARDSRDASPSREGRDGRDGRRPGGTVRPRPGAIPQNFQPPMENEQSRKKRNKGRKQNEFSDSMEDFARRRNAGLNIIPDMDDDEGEVRSRSRSHKQKKQQQSHAPVPSTQPMKAAKRRLRIEESIRVADMAHQLGVKSSEIIKVLFGLGVMATINMALDIDTATLVASEFGYEVEKVGFSEEELIPTVADAPEMLKPRPPVVTIMGHVDHGKTSLLDAIRKTSVTSGEAGGITQHIGAYHVKTKKGDIVFLDTPGHAAFTAMRARGAQVTDLVVLVVAADDGVMDQTREAINHSRAAGVPILVAVNKIDKPTANPDRVLRELSELGLQPEAWGGETVVGMVSAKTGQGLDDLLELIALQAEILELKANPDKPARGHVVEAKLDKGRGPVATVLIQEGTIHQGDVFVCGVFSGRVRAMFNDQGRKIKQAGPSMPVEVQGFEGVPEAGEEFICLEEEKTARRIAESRAAKQREKELAKVSRVTLENFLKQNADAKEALVLNVVLKADVQGSLEAITESLRKLSTEKVRIEIIHGGAGAISESDVMLATASNAIIIGFNVRPTAKVKEMAEQEHVDIRFYDIIYKLVDEVKSAMAGMLAPVSKEVYLGQAEVRQTFSLPKIGVIAGCMVTDGKLTRTAHARLLRDGGTVVYTGKIASLKRLKDDAKEVVRNLECGVGLDNFHDIKIGDVIEAFDMVEEAASLD